jgi:hypothetical protein
MSFVTINDPKKRNEIIEENLRLRRKLKVKNEENENTQNEMENNRVNLFKPIIECNQKLQNETIENQNKIIESLKKLKIKDKPKLLEIEERKEEQKTYTLASKLIVEYLQDLTDRSQAGYSIRFDEKTKTLNIGNKIVVINNNDLKIGNNTYNATPGLMELLLKKSPNFNLVDAEDKKAYKQILSESNAIYQGFNSSQKKLNSDRTEKWHFIKTELIDKSLQRPSIADID